MNIVKEMWTDSKWMVLFIAGLLIALAILIPVAIAAQGKWEAWCEAQGGRVDSSTSIGTGMGVGANGSPTVVTTSSTTYYCLSPDGQILDVQ